MASGKTENLQVRVEPEVLDRLDRLAEQLTARAMGVEVNRTAAARAVVLKGLEVMEKELAAEK
jgi:predicted transcriptional regulator